MSVMVSKMKIPRERFHKVTANGDIKIEIAYRIGKRSKVPRPVVVKFCDLASKKICFSHAKNLAGSKIAMTDDLAGETREKRIAQVPLMKEYKAKCSSNVKVSMIRDKLSGLLNSVVPQSVVLNLCVHSPGMKQLKL